MVEKLTDASSKKYYQEAMFKIKSVLRYTEKEMLEAMDDHIEVLENPYLPSKANNAAHLQTILKSIAGKEILDIGYFANHTQQYSNREVEPVGIFYSNSSWYMIGYCRLRKDYRHFRTDRISYVNATARHFDKQHPSLKSFLNKISQQKEMFTIVISVEKAVLKYFGEQKYYNGFVSQKEVNGKMEMTFVTGSLAGFAKFYLLFGEYADIISPASLKELVQQNISAISKRLK
jgi:predicted DNA-binding transcriptional regulator YafY